MNNVWVTSDTHFFHKNILKYQPKERPFSSVEEMNDVMVKRWNEKVKPNDEIYHLGDFAFASRSKTIEILERLNGKKFLILGNHDHGMKHSDISKYFEWIKNYHELKHNGNYVVMFHYPIHSWNRIHFGAYHFYGHTHFQIPHIYHGLSMDIGVDGNDLYPHNIDDLFEMFKRVKEETGEGFFDPRGRSERR